LKTIYPLPIKGTISSGYGPRWGTQHYGIDIAVPDGTDVLSIADGVVARSDMTNKTGYGNFMCVEHNNINGKKKFSCYAHLTQRLKEVGDKVKRGDLIAKSGGGQGVEAGGGKSTGPHLHFEIRNSLTGGFEDPKPYLEGVEITKGNKKNKKNKGGNTSGTLFSGGLKPKVISTPSDHAKRSTPDWSSKDAWDLQAPIGTSVYALTKGKVSNKHESSGSKSNVFGTQLSISGMDGYPSIFYTHIQDVKLKVGDIVEPGDFIGNITKWETYPDASHVHIGIDNKKDIYSFMDKDGKLKNYKSSNDSKDDEEETDSEDDGFKLGDIFAGVNFKKLSKEFGKSFKSNWDKTKDELEKEKRDVYENVDRIKDIMKKIL
jgi:murein DD-endopeptidase MepM/ murein hydrolase activator NlpD